MVYRTRYESVQVADNLYCYIWQGMGNNCNSSLLTNLLSGERPHVIIDPGHMMNEAGEACFDNLVKAMEGDGLKVGDVGLVINTHSHADHCQASEILAGKNDALVALSKEEDEFRNTIGARMYSMFGIETPEFTPFFYLEDGILELGDKDKVSIEILLTPGHSPGSVCLY